MHESKRTARFGLIEDVRVNFAHCLRSAEDFTFPVEAKRCFDIVSNFFPVFRVKNHMVELGGQENPFELGMVATVSKGAMARSEHDSAVADFLLL